MRSPAAGTGSTRGIVRLAATGLAATAVSGASADPGAEVGFPWGWTMVAAVAAAGIAATVAAVRRTRSLDGGAPGTAAVYGRATALIDGGRAALVRAPAEVPAASWRRLDDEAGDVLGALHVAAGRAQDASLAAAFRTAAGPVAALSAALGAAADAAGSPDRLLPVLEELHGRLDDTERAIEPLKAAL